MITRVGSWKCYLYMFLFNFCVVFLEIFYGVTKDGGSGKRCTHSVAQSKTRVHENGMKLDSREIYVIVVQIAFLLTLLAHK